MKIVQPANIHDIIVIDYNETVSADENLAEWDPLKADYAFEDEVKVAADKKKYKLATQTVSAGVVPKDNLDIWIPSPLSELAMFVYDNDYSSSLNGNFKGTIPDAFDIDTLYFQNIDGDSIVVSLLDANDGVIEVLEDEIYDWEIDSFFKYMFPDDPVLKNKIQFDFVDLRIEKIIIEIRGSQIDCSFAIAGYKQDVGVTMRDGIGFTQNNFYANERDSWGNLISTKLRVIEDVSLPVREYSENISKNINKISHLFGSPNLFIGDDRDKENADFPFINIFGILTSNSVTPGGSVTDTILKIEGK